MSHNSTYRELMAIANAMNNDTLQKRREAARKLEQMLSSARVRQQLVVEASETQDRKAAMAGFWRLVVQQVIASIMKIHNSSSKLTQADILVGFSLVKCCDIPDETMTSEEARYKGTFRLTRKEMRMVLNFCLELLNDEQASSICELDLLDMLAYLAGSRGYMSYLKSQNDIKVIMEEVGKRIGDESLPHAVRQKTAEIFCNLCITTKDLGIEMRTLVPGSVKMVSDWCSNAYRSTQQRPSAEMSPLLSGLTTMLRLQPEQAIAPLSRHGKAILRLAKSRYRRVADRSQRHVLNQYFLCHLIVAQTGGELRGLLPGDLGDLGEATLTHKQIADLLQLVIDRNEELPGLSRAVDLESNSLDDMQQTHLELIARLLACSQRIALCQLEHKRMGDLTNLLIDRIGKIPKPDELPSLKDENESFAASADDVVSHAPFMRLILSSLFRNAVTGLSTRPNQIRVSEKEEWQIPLLQAFIAFQDGEEDVSAQETTSTRSSLQIIAACAEAFPTGACWASRSRSCWFEIPRINKDEREMDHRRHIHGCDPSDLASVVAVVASVLDSNGDHSGDADTQKWCFRCLIRLAKSTSCLLLVDPKSDFSVLGKAWQSVWSIIFRSDLRYLASTADARPESVAELVLWTLSAIIQHRCTDPITRWSEIVRERRSTFLYRRQADIWNLPVFSLVGDTSSLAPLQIIVALLHSVGLSEGSDSICQGLRFKGLQIKTLPESTRRRRLLNFCLCKMEDPTLKGAAACTVASLVHGHESKWSKSVENSRSSAPVLGIDFDEEQAGHNIFDALWSPHKPVLPELGTKLNKTDDAVTACLRRLEAKLRCAESLTTSADVVANSGTLVVLNELNLALQSFRDKEPSFEPNEAYLAMKTAVSQLKVDLTILMPRNKGPLLSSALDQLAPRIADLLKTVREHFPQIMKKHTEFLLEVLCIVDFVVLITSSESLDLPHSIVDESQDLAEELEKSLENHFTDSAYDESEAEEQEETVEVTKQDLDADELEESLMDDGTPSSSRKRSRAASKASSRKRSRRTEVSSSFLQDSMRVAKLLFALKPNLRTVRLLCERLLRVDLDRPLTFYDSNLKVDPLLAACLAKLFLPLLRAHDSRANNAGGALLCRLVRMTRKLAPPHSVLNLFGYQECANFCGSGGWEDLHPQTVSDANELLSVWKDLDSTEQRVRSLRPHLRSVSTATLSQSFLGGDSVIRAQWEKEYPKLVLSTLFDTSMAVRQSGALGVAGSLAVMSSQDKVIESTRRNLAPVSSDDGEFRDWYKTLNKEIAVAGRQAWEDAKASVEFGSVLTLSLLGGCTSNRTQQETLLFRIIEIAHDRDDLEACCFLLVDHFAQISGFGTAENALIGCQDGLLKRWVRKTKGGGLLEVPFLLSSPALLRFLIQTSSFSASSESELKLEHIRSHSAKEFFARNSRFVLPYLLSTAPNTDKPSIQLEEFCSVYGDEKPEEMVGTLVKGHVSSLTACCSVFQCISSKSEKLASRIIQVLEHCKAETSATLPSTAKYFVQQACTIFMEEECSGYAQRIADKFAELTGETTTDTFHQVGSTLSEFCIRSRGWIQQSDVEWLNQSKIQALQVLWGISCKSLQRGRGVTHLDFLLLNFSELLSEDKSLSFTVQALGLLNGVFHQLTNENSATAFSQDAGFKEELRTLFCSVWRLHERYQIALLRASSETAELRSCLVRKSLGLTSDASLSTSSIDGIVGDTNMQSSPKKKARESHAIAELLESSKEVLQVITENCSLLGIESKHDLKMMASASVVSGADLDHLDSLGYGAVSLVDVLDGTQGSFMAEPDLYLRLTSGRFAFVGNRTGSPHLSPHEHLLVSELKHLYNFLSDSDLSSLMKNRALLLEQLSALCLNTPHDIRAAASRCLGALQCTSMQQDYFSTNTAGFFNLLPEKELQLALEGRCLELLMEMVKSPHILTAMIAMETAKALLSSGLEPSGLPPQLLSHFVASDQVSKSSVVLNNAEVRQIKDCFTSKETWVEWCWDEAFWISCFEIEFGDWICNLVPAILSCHANKKNGFLSYCQRMSHTEPRFAEWVFPLVIVQLLQEQSSLNNTDSYTAVQCDTWVGNPDSSTTQQISKCFAAVLKKCAHQPRVSDSKAVGLLVDTLDLIRRLEQHQFQMSNAHVRNPTSMKAFRGGGAASTPSTPTTPSDGTPPSQSQDYPLEDDPVKWVGLPVGVGLFINGIDLAKACLKVKRYFSAIFYAEHYAEHRFGGSTQKLGPVIEMLLNEAEPNLVLSCDISGFPASASETGSSGPGYLIEDAKAYLDIMAKSSQALDENDHLQALVSHQSDMGLMGEQSTLSSQVRANLSSPVETMRAVGETTQVALQCLSEMRLYGTLQTSIEGLSSRGGLDDEFESKMRDKWFEGCLFGNSLESLSGGGADTTRQLPSSEQTAGFCESILSALHSLYRDDQEICRIHIENARKTTFDQISGFVAAEASAAASFTLIDKMNCLNDLEAVISNQGGFPAKWNLGKDSETILERDLSLSGWRTTQPFSDRIQVLVLQHMSNASGPAKTAASNLLSSVLWRSANNSCRNHKLSDAQTAFQQLSSLHGNNSNCPEFFRVRHLEARILEKKGDFSSAIRHVSQSLNRLHLYPLKEEHQTTEADLRISCGRWMAMHRIGSGENVLDKFLRPGLGLARKILSECPTKEAAWRLTEACIALGDLVYDIYETISSRVKSPEWRKAGASLRSREDELREIEDMAKGQTKKKTKISQQDWESWIKDLLIYKQNLSRDVHQLKSERQKIERSIGEYRDLAFHTLIEALSAADDSYTLMSKYVYRVVSLWFMPGVSACDTSIFDAIPSYRFVPLSNQLFSRIGQSNELLQRLTKRLCLDHPYHCLAQMVRLTVGNPPTTEREKAKASVACEILDSIKLESPDFLKLLVENYSRLIESYVFLAEAPTDEFVRGKMKKIRFSAVYKNCGNVISLDNFIGKGSRKRQCPPCVLTSLPKLRPRCDYGGGLDDPIGGERIASYDERFTIADSGITRPKIVNCYGSKGVRFKQLVKGGDDCRGDAVMQQVFEYVNELFAQETGQDRLRIVTYTIIPTSTTTGVLEWVENTLPFGDYLQDRARKGVHVGAHSKYFPGEWNAYLCKEYLKNAPRTQKKEAFETICKFHSPVFRFFFVERFGHSTRVWYEAKNRFTRSVAVTSFVGHILGIGDRHSSNILVHQKTGEVVHIDFGIVFEQGKLLQVPERVPFRLTRNVVDGMGPTGVEGRFTTTSHQTLKALRQNGESLLTILSAITADPLYRWSLNPKLERKRQEFLGNSRVARSSNQKSNNSSNGAENNETASQAVRKVKAKLSGYEDGTAGEQQSTEGQVHFLINLARDVDLLSQMYIGWAPWS